MLWLFLCYALICVICYKQAKARGRDPYVWAGIGMLFGILGLTALFLLPPIPSTIGLKKKPPPLVFPSLQILDSFQNSTIWYYLDKEHNQLGPMSFEGISKAWEEGKIDRISYVWNERMENWKRLHEVVQPEN